MFAHRARSAASCDGATDASSSGVPSPAATTKDMPSPAAAGAAAPCRRSDTGPRAVGITYSLVVSSMDAGGAGVTACSTATAPSRARSDEAAATGSR
jgi:hypothetical protein